jgi:TPP-dependent pyruvate/acetoin dehydrogenase alpha subunit
MKMATARKRAEDQSNLPFAFKQYSAAELKEVLRKMYLIRRFEEGAEDSYTRGLIHGTMHLSIGQEASAMGICMPPTSRWAISAPTASWAAASRSRWAQHSRPSA